ncbi:MAG: TRAM domain-containing protein [Candidatus ainarchaeum sp.]|nr:TRAM domain-containing protein [Candidatus ainarchaeum sp.]
MEEEKKGFEIPKPIKEGEILEVTIDNVSRKGDGVAKVNGFVVFVKDGKTGEKVKVKVITVGRTYAIAEKV